MAIVFLFDKQGAFFFLDTRFCIVYNYASFIVLLGIAQRLKL